MAEAHQDDVPATSRNRLPSEFLLAIASATLILAGTGAYLVYVFGAPDLTFWKPPGQIYVESPEVYTRERLVNDRYLQAAWLDEKLTAVKNASFQARRLATSFSFNAGNAAPNANAPPKGGHDEGVAGGNSAEGTGATDTPEQMQFPFDVDYDLQSAMRDKIRQDIIENMLDDRHDLTGNSLVALKFDTTVLKRRNSRYIAKAAFRVTAEKLFPEPADGPVPPIEQRLIEAFYFSNRNDNILGNEGHELHRSYTRYNDWLHDIEYRLNRELSRACARFERIDQTTVPKIFRDSLSKILAVQSEFDFPDTASVGAQYVPLPRPWSDVFVLQYSSKIMEERNCSAVHINTLPLASTIFVMEAKDQEELEDAIDHLAASDSIYVRILVDGLKLYITTRNGTAIANEPIPQLTYGFAAQIYNAFSRRNNKSIYYMENSGKLCIGSPDDNNITNSGNTKVAELYNFCKPDDLFPKKGNLASIFFPAGYFNFMKKVERSDAYLYSLIPNGTSTAQLLSKSARLRLSMAGPGAPNAAMSEKQIAHDEDMSAFETQPEVLTYGSAGPAEVIEFGWMAVNEGRHAGPESFSQTALLSVPAWADEIKAEVRTSWIDHAGNTVFEDSEWQPFSIPLPPNYEIFDAFMSNGATYRRPKIDTSLFGKQLLQNGKSGSITIPGARLWRSTVVTLGNERAREIFVLPDMEGIIATFNEINVYFDETKDCKQIAPNPGPTAQLAATEAVPPAPPVRSGRQRCTQFPTLRVWTSEGMDSLDGQVTVVDIRDDDTTGAVHLPPTGPEATTP